MEENHIATTSSSCMFRIVLHTPWDTSILRKPADTQLVQMGLSQALPEHGELVWVGAPWVGSPPPWFLYIGDSSPESAAVAHLQQWQALSFCCLTWRKGAPWKEPSDQPYCFCCGDAQATFGFSKKVWLVRRKEGVGSIYANPCFPAPQAAVLPAPAQWGYSQPQGGHHCTFVPQMNLDIKVLPLLMSTDVLFTVFTVLGDREIFTG